LDSQSFNLYYITLTTATSLRSLPHSVTFSKQKCDRQDGITRETFFSFYDLSVKKKAFGKDGNKNGVSSPALSELGKKKSNDLYREKFRDRIKYAAHLFGSNFIHIA
jgi:hypothetical protein